MATTNSQAANHLARQVARSVRRISMNGIRYISSVSTGAYRSSGSMSFCPTAFIRKAMKAKKPGVVNLASRSQLVVRFRAMYSMRPACCQAVGKRAYASSDWAT